MSLEKVARPNRGEFVSYGGEHRFEHDESFLSEWELDRFDPEDVAWRRPPLSASA